MVVHRAHITVIPSKREALKLANRHCHECATWYGHEVAAYRRSSRWGMRRRLYTSTSLETSGIVGKANLTRICVKHCWCHIIERVGNTYYITILVTSRIRVCVSCVIGQSDLTHTAGENIMMDVIYLGYPIPNHPNVSISGHAYLLAGTRCRKESPSNCVHSEGMVNYTTSRRRIRRNGRSGQVRSVIRARSGDHSD